jgi:Cysteine-rich secretory protein family
MILKLLIVLGLTICIVQSDEENYCDPTLCDDGLTHTACDHYLVRTAKMMKKKLVKIINENEKQEFAQDCGEDAEIVLMSAMHKKLILDLHNQFRSKIATGKVPGYAPAARMPALRWNEDLAYVAGLHARSCSTENDSCRNTRIFKNVGQNIGYDTITEPHNNVTAVIKRIFTAWHAEFKLGNQNNMKMLSPETL